MRRTAAALCLSALAACTVGPDYAPPNPPAGAAGGLVTRVDATLPGAEPPDDWWRLYDDPLLDRLLEEAFAANADLTAAEANLGSARAALEATRSSRVPSTQAKAGGVFGRDPTTDEILELTGRKPETGWLFDAALDVSYEVDLFGRITRLIEAAKANADVAETARDALGVTVAAETTRAYAQMCTLGEQLAVAHRSLDLVTRETEIIRERRAAGASTDFDVVRAIGLQAQTRAAVPVLEGQRSAALFQLTALLGRTPANAPPEVEGCAEPPKLGGAIPIGDGASLLRRRPDVRQADRRLAAAVAQIGVATADLYPRISLAGFYGGFTDKIDLLATQPALGWGVGPSITWAFPNQLGPRARVRQAEAGGAAALASFDSAVLQALKETEQALAAYRAELSRHADLAEVRESAVRAFALAKDQFAVGTASTLDLLTSQQTLVSAEAALAASDGALVQDQIAIFKALGGGWMRRAPVTQSIERAAYPDQERSPDAAERIGR